MTDTLRSRLDELRLSLLTLHKALVESERVGYEKTMGPIHSPQQFLQLLTRDPWFAWLQPLSLLIVSIDEVLEEQEPLTPDRAEAVIKQAGRLLSASEAGEGFARHYFDALQRDPDVVMAHAAATRLFNPRKPSR
ncbi:MAG TPA: hypothetical protein VK327_11365 [Candidatus Paceibacterota bacterium]|nr:hypothetical protein [Candidatus Paceibacterota bacterium]